MGSKTKKRRTYPALVVLSDELGQIPTPHADLADKLGGLQEALNYHLERRALLAAVQADNDQRITALRHLEAAYTAAGSHWPADPITEA